MTIKTETFKIDNTILKKDIQDIQEFLRIELVSNTHYEALWDMLIEKYHYLGSAKAIGPKLKYIIWFNDRPVSAISFNQAVYKLGARERFLNWNDKEKQEYLKHVLNNNRFLILPWIKIKNLASHIMSLSICKIKVDWSRIYGSEPYILETFVDREKYTGTCYKASNWCYIGETRGFKKVGKTYKYHGNRKLIFLYFINKNYKNLISCTGRPRQILKKWHKPLEKIYMQIQQNEWHPELLKEANVKNIISQLGDKLKSHMERFKECFYRIEQQFNANIYVKGLLSNLERKSIEPISLEFNPDKRGVRNLQFFMKNANWDEKKALNIYQQGLSDRISDENGMITIDESGNRKKGSNSIGVASQYCGSIGKVDNAQVGVYLGYSSHKGYGLISSRIFMPEKWFTEDYKAKRDACLVPSDATFKTKPQIAIELLHEIKKSGYFQAKWIGVDSLYGNNRNFLNSIPKEYFYFADISSDSQIWDSKPSFSIPEYSGRGRKATKEIPSIPSRKVADVAKDESIPWKNVYLGEGSKGSIYANVKCIRVYKDFSTEKDQFDLQECWLYIREREDGEIRYSISNAPADIDELELHKASLMRWPIEQCFLEMKGQLGMDHCEARSWPAWHRHMLMVFIAYEFLLEIRLLVTDKKKDRSYH